MQYNYPFRADRQKESKKDGIRSPLPPNLDYFAQGEHRPLRTGRPGRPVRSLQRTQLSSGDSSGERKCTPDNFFKRKTSGSPVTLKEHLRNRMKAAADVKEVLRVRCKRYADVKVNRPAQAAKRPPKCPPHDGNHQTPSPHRGTPHRKQQVFLWKEEEVKWTLEKKAMEVYRREIYMRREYIPQPNSKAHDTQQYQNGRRVRGRYFESTRNKQRAKRPSECPVEQPHTQRLKSSELGQSQSPSRSNHNYTKPYPAAAPANFQRQLSFKQPSLASLKSSEPLIVPEIPQQPPKVPQRSSTIKPPGVVTFGTLPLEQEQQQQKYSAAKPAAKPVQPPPINVQIRAAAPITEQPFDENNPYQYPKSDSASNSGSSKSLKLESTISRKAVRRVGGRSRLSSKIINISTIRNSKMSVNPQFDEMMEKIQLHIEVVNRIAEYVECSSNLYDERVWRSENFMMYKRYYMERMRVQESLNGYRNCFILNEVEVKKDVLAKYMGKPEVQTIAQQVSRHNSEVKVCMEQMHKNLRIRSGGHPTLNILFDRLSTTRLHHDIINFLVKQFVVLRRLFPVEEDEQRKAAIEQRLIDILQLAYLLEQLSDNFVRSFLECQEVYNFQQFLQNNEPVFLALAKKYSKPN